MYSPAPARFLPTRVATVPKKLKGVPPPQSLNPGTLAASNPVVHPNSLIGSIIGGIGGLLFGSATEGSEGNNPCAAWGCYPGPPDFSVFDDIPTFQVCECTRLNLVPIFGHCGMGCFCRDPFGLPILDFGPDDIAKHCGGLPGFRSTCPRFALVVRVQLLGTGFGRYKILECVN